MVEIATLGAPIKQAYEGEDNTNAFTDAEKTKLAGIEAGADVTPSNVSAFTNDAGYITIDDVPPPSGGGVVPVTTIATSGASQALTFAASGDKAYDITLTANCTLTLSGGQTGQFQKIYLILRQDATAGRIATLPNGIKWPGNVTPVPNILTGRIDKFILSTPDAGATIFGDY